MNRLLIFAVFAALAIHSQATVNAWNGRTLDTSKLINGATKTSVNGVSIASGGGAPTITSVAMASGGTSFTSNYSASVSVGAGGAAGFAATPSAGATTVGSIVGLPGTSGTHTSSRTILMFEEITFAYTQPGEGVEATVGTVDVATVSGITVQNNSTQMTDNMVRADNSTLGPNWTDDVAGIGIVSNEASTIVFGITRWTATTPGNDQIVWIRIGTRPTDSFVLVGARLTSGGDGYGVGYDGTDLTINRFDAGESTVLATQSASFTTGDWIGIGVVGNTITAYKNSLSSTVTSTTDSTYPTGGNCGIAINPSGGTTTVTGFVISKQ